MGQVAVLAGAAEDHELSGGQRLAQGAGIRAQQGCSLCRPAEAVGRAHGEAVEHHAIARAGPERLGDGVAVPDPVQKLTAYGVEAHPFELAGEVGGRGPIVRPVAAGVDSPGPRDGGIEALVQRRLAALVPQDVAVDAERLALVAVAVGVARRLARVERQLADIGLEAAGDAGGGGLTRERPLRHAGAGRRQQPAEPGREGRRHYAGFPSVGRDAEDRAFIMPRSSDLLPGLCTAPWCGAFSRASGVAANQ